MSQAMEAWGLPAEDPAARNRRISSAHAFPWRSWPTPVSALRAAQRAAGLCRVRLPPGTPPPFGTEASASRSPPERTIIGIVSPATLVELARHHLETIRTALIEPEALLLDERAWSILDDDFEDPRPSRLVEARRAALLVLPLLRYLPEDLLEHFVCGWADAILGVLDEPPDHITLDEDHEDTLRGALELREHKGQNPRWAEQARAHQDELEQLESKWSHIRLPIAAERVLHVALALTTRPTAWESAAAILDVELDLEERLGQLDLREVDADLPGAIVATPLWRAVERSLVTAFQQLP